MGVQRCGDVIIRCDGGVRDFMTAGGDPFLRVALVDGAAVISGLRLQVRDVPRLHRFADSARSADVEGVG